MNETCSICGAPMENGRCTYCGATTQNTTQQSYQDTKYNQGQPYYQEQPFNQGQPYYTNGPVVGQPVVSPKNRSVAHQSNPDSMWQLQRPIWFRNSTMVGESNEFYF